MGAGEQDRRPPAEGSARAAPEPAALRHGTRRGPGARFLIRAVVTVSALCVAGVSGAVVISRTAAGRGLALDWLMGRLAPAINGSLTVGSVSPGGLLGAATVHDVRIRDVEGHTVLTVDSVRASYSVATFFGGRPGLADLQLWSPVAHLAPADGRRIQLDSLLVPGAFSDPSDPGSGPGFTILGGRIHGGTVFARGMDDQVVHIHGVEARMGRVDVGPGPDPEVVAAVDDLALSYPLGNGVLQLRDIRGVIRGRKPVLTAEVEHFALPASEGRGVIDGHWSVEGWSTVFDLDVDRMELTDLSWLDERFDRGSARGEVRIAVDRASGQVDLAGVRARLGGARLGLSGTFAIGDAVRFENVVATPARLPTSELNRWLPVPTDVAGVLSGEVRLDGSPLRVSASGRLALESEDGGGTLARVSGGGAVVEGRSVEDLRLSVEDFDFGLLAELVEQVPWTGRGEMTVRLDGDIRTGMAVEIGASQRTPEGGASSIAVMGTVYGDTAISVVDLEARLEPLSLTMVGEMYPGFALSGDARGAVSLSGSLQELQFASELETAAGRLAAEGQINALDPASGYHVEASVHDFLLGEFVAGLPEPFRLSASATLSGRGLDLESVRGSLVLRVDSSALGLIDVDSAGVDAWVDEEGLLRVESAYLGVGGAAIGGAGTLGTASAAGDGVTLAVSSPSIRPLRDAFMGENLVAWDELLPIEQSIMIEFDGVDPDTFPRARDIRFDGRAEGLIRVEGSVRDLIAHADIALEELEYGPLLARALQADLEVRGMGLPAPAPAAADSAASPPPAGPGPLALAGTVTGDSVSLGDRRFRSVLVEGGFAFGEGGRLRTLVSRSATESYDVQGVVGLSEQGGRIDLDRFTLVSDTRRWNLRGPARFEWDAAAVQVRDFGLIRPGTEGLRVHADGRLARDDGESDFEMEFAELDLAVMGSLLQMDAPPRGVVSGSLRARGTGRDPQWAGAFDVSDIEIGALSFDRVSAGGSSSGRTLVTRVEAWRGERRNLLAQGTVPLDLRLRPSGDRIPDEPLDLRIQADSFPAAMLLAALDGLEGVAGTVSGDVRLAGPPSALAPEGSLHLRDGQAVVAAFGTRLSAAEMDLDLDPSGVVSVDGSAAGGGGTVDVRGTVDLAGVQNDIGLELAFWPREFQIVDRVDIEAAITGDALVLTNTFNYPLVVGQVEVVDGTVFIDEFRRSAEIVDLYDPALFSAATAQLGLAGEGDGEDAVGDRSPFLQNLRVIVDLELGRGNRLWSPHMNVETSGQLSLTFDRAGNQFIIYGDGNVVRGTYSLGSRTLRMTEGTFRFPGTPGFDPGISVTAVTRLPACEGEPQEVTTNLSGTLLRPRVSIESDTERATSESQLYNLLLLGRCSSALGATAAASVLPGWDLLAGQVGNVIGNEFARELDLDFLSVSQADFGLATTALGASSLQVEVGRYLRDNIFVTGVYRRGYCADPTIPVSSGGMRVEVALPRDLTMESFLEGRCTREQYRGLDDISLQLARIWGFSFFREWGY